jgi:putative oxidoreductase
LDAGGDPEFPETFRRAGHRNVMQKAYRLLINLGNALRHPLLLVMRLFWGWQLFLTGKGKLMNLDKTAGFFESLHIPMPKLNALMAGSVECFGGLLLLLGLGSRLVSIPVAFTMIIAYVTADREAIMGIFTDPDKFTGAAPFLFLLTAIVMLAFGPGCLSLDAIIGRKFATDKK